MNHLVPLVVLLLSASFAQADTPDSFKLKDNKSILGKWKLYAEAPAMHKEKKLVNIVWDFKKDGTLIASATDTRARTRAMSIKLKYFVEDGAIKKQDKPGRDKYETCSVIQKKAKEMVLKCRYLYFFLKR